MEDNATMCAWSEEDIAKEFDEFVRRVSNPKFYCTGCGRVANTEKWVCTPKPLPQVKD